MSPDPTPADSDPIAKRDPIDRALAESPDQNYVGARDLTRWPTAAGRFALDVTVRAARWLAPNRVLVITLLLGLVVVAGLTAAAASVYEAVVEADGIAGLDQPALAVAMRLRTTTGNRIVNTFSDLGGPVEMPILATVVAVALALWWRQWTPIVLTAATGLGSLLLTMVGKAIVGRTRPPLADAVPPFESSFSFPSGHSLNALAMAGIVAYLLVRKQHSPRVRALTVSLASAFAVLMGLSRVYLGHHWLTDVLVAWALALAWLGVVITAHRLFLTVRRSTRTAARPSRDQTGVDQTGIDQTGVIRPGG